MHSIFPASLVLAVLASTASADCPTGAQELVSCTLKGGRKVLTTCLMDQTASYSFGAAHKAPDLHLTRHVRDVDYTPWPGIGRTIWEEFSFENKGVRYLVHFSVDKAPGSVMQGGVIVMQGETELASLDCDPGSVAGQGYSMRLYDAKVAAGQSFSLQTQSWVDN